MNFRIKSRAPASQGGVTSLSAADMASTMTRCSSHQLCAQLARERGRVSHERFSFTNGPACDPNTLRLRTTTRRGRQSGSFPWDHSVQAMHGDAAGQRRAVMDGLMDYASQRVVRQIVPNSRGRDYRAAMRADVDKFVTDVRAACLDRTAESASGQGAGGCWTRPRNVTRLPRDSRLLAQNHVQPGTADLDVAVVI
jgi:hypothetical protein